MKRPICAINQVCPSLDRYTSLIRVLLSQLEDYQVMLAYLRHTQSQFTCYSVQSASIISISKTHLDTINISAVFIWDSVNRQETSKQWLNQNFSQQTAWALEQIVDLSHRGVFIQMRNMTEWENCTESGEDDSLSSLTKQIMFRFQCSFIFHHFEIFAAWLPKQSLKFDLMTVKYFSTSFILCKKTKTKKQNITRQRDKRH